MLQTDISAIILYNIKRSRAMVDILQNNIYVYVYVCSTTMYV